MKYLLISHFGINLLWVIISTADDSAQYKLTAVSDGHVAEALYRRAKAEVPYVYEPSELETNIKDQFCHHITGSGLFLNRWKEKRVSILEMKNKLKETYPDVYDSLFETIKGEGVYTNRTTKYKNVYHSEKVQESGAGPFTEYAFKCLATKEPEFADQKEDAMYTYYISSEYHLGDERDPYVPGRFIFAYTETTHKSRLIPRAVAERPARRVLSQEDNVEDWYLKWRKSIKSNLLSKLQNENSSTCALSVLQRSRVCSLILNSQYFEKELIFTSSDANVGHGCDEKTISFQSEESGEKSYSEKCVSCKADVVNTHYQKDFFFSRVYSHSAKDMVFVYRPTSDSKVILIGLFDEVRFRLL